MKTKKQLIGTTTLLFLIFLTNVTTSPSVDPPTGKIIGKVKLINHNGKAVNKPELMVAAKGGIQNVVITIEGTEGEFKEDPISIDQKNKTYWPRVSVSMVGNELTFLNNDAILHNVHSYRGMETLYNVAMPKFIKKRITKLEQPGLMTVRCDVHQEMKAYVVVADNPHYTITNKAGLFEINSIPAGTYKIKAWHETLGSIEKEVTIVAGEKTAVIFELALDN